MSLGIHFGVPKTRFRRIFSVGVCGAIQPRHLGPSLVEKNRTIIWYPAQKKSRVGLNRVETNSRVGLNRVEKNSRVGLNRVQKKSRVGLNRDEKNSRVGLSGCDCVGVG